MLATKRPKDPDVVSIDEVVNLNNILVDEKASLLTTTYTIVNGSNEAKVIKQGSDIPTDNESITTNRDVALLFGTMAHKLLENIVNAKAIQLPESICENIGNEYNAPVELINRLKTVYQTIYGGGYPQNNPELNDNLYQLVKEHSCLTETPYSFYENKIINYGVIDLIVFIDNTIYVIDYKTDSKEIDHSSQLNAYKKIVEKIANPPIVELIQIRRIFYQRHHQTVQLYPHRIRRQARGAGDERRNTQGGPHADRIRQGFRRKEGHDGEAVGLRCSASRQLRHHGRTFHLRRRQRDRLARQGLLCAERLRIL